MTLELNRIVLQLRFEVSPKRSPMTSMFRMRANVLYIYRIIPSYAAATYLRNRYMFVAKTVPLFELKFCSNNRG